MKTLIFVLCFLPEIIWATPASFIDGKLTFAIATIDGEPAFSSTQKAAMIAANPSGIVVDLVPTALEIAVSTTFTKFGTDNISQIDDFRQTLSSKPFIVQKGIDVTADLVAAERIQVLYPALPTQGTINRLKAQLNLLVAIWSSL